MIDNTTAINTESSSMITLTISCHCLPQNNPNKLMLQRRGHTTVLYKDRYLIVFGGCDMRGNFLSDILRFDLQTCQWTEISSYGEMPCGRYGHSTCIHNDYYMYIYGGYYMNKTNELSCLNLETGDWKILQCKGQMPPGTDGHSMVIYNNKLIIFGGRKKSWISINLIHILDLQTLEWRRVDINDPLNVPCPRTDHCEVLHEGKLYIQGGYDDGGQFLGRRNDLFVFDVKNESWTQLTGKCNGIPPPEMSTNKSSCIEFNGKHYMIMVAGWDNYKRHRNDVYGLELETLTWIHFPPLKSSIFHERRHFGMVKVPSSIRSDFFRENDLIVFGGCSDTVMLSDICVLRLSDQSLSGEIVEISPTEDSSIDLRAVELWKQMMKDHSSLLHRIAEFGSCYDLLEWSLVNKTQWNTTISRELLQKSLISYWNLRNRHLMLGRNSNIVKLLPKEVTPNILPEQEDTITIQTVKNVMHQLTDVFSNADPHENVVWTSFPKINSLLGIVKLSLPNLERQINSLYSIYMGIHSTCFEEYPFITSIIATSRKIQSTRETFILFDPFVGSLIFSEKVMQKMVQDFKRIIPVSEISESYSENGYLEDILSVISRNTQAKIFNRKFLYQPNEFQQIE